MKKKHILLIALLLCAIGAVWWWLAGGKDLPDMIPAKSKAVVRMSDEAMQNTGMAERIATLTSIPIDKSQTEGNAYFFITPNEYFGLAAALKDADALLEALPKEVLKEEEDGVLWLWSPDGWLSALQGSKLLMLGPATAQERDRLRHTLQVMMDAPEDEGFGHTPQAEVLRTDAPMAFVASGNVLPAPYGTMLRLTLTKDKALLAGVATEEGDGLLVSGAPWHEGFQPSGSTTLKSQSAPVSQQLLTATLRMDGRELLKRLRADGSARMLLTALSDSTSAADDMARMQGTVNLLISSLDTAGTPVFRMEGKDSGGKPVVLQTKGATFDEQPAFSEAKNLRAEVDINITTLLSAPLPAEVKAVISQLFGGFSRARLTTTMQGDFLFELRH